MKLGVIALHTLERTCLFILSVWYIHMYTYYKIRLEDLSVNLMFLLVRQGSRPLGPLEARDQSPDFFSKSFKNKKSRLLLNKSNLPEDRVRNRLRKFTYLFFIF